MAHPPVQAIILDLGNVLLFYDEQVEQTRLAALIGISVAQLMPPYRKNISALQRGEIDGKGFIARICRALRKPMPSGAAMFLAHALRTIGRLNRPMLALSRQLGARYRVAVLSNTYHDHARWYHRQPWIRCFDYVFFSNERGLDKPHAAAFRFVVRKLGCKSAECIFTDDKPPNIRGAKVAGLRAVRFRSTVQFKKYLKRNGVKC